MTKTDEKKQLERIQYAFDSVLKKLDLDYILFFVKRKQKVYFYIERNLRGKEDKNSFIISYNPEIIINKSNSEIRDDAFHEILHAMTWDYSDEYSSVIKYIKNKELRKELETRNFEVREQVTYLLERKFGPLIFPDFNPKCP